MRSKPDDEYDEKELERLNADPWMVEQLSLNPDYTCWGPHEDYMFTKGDGWNAPIEMARWSDMFGLDDMNECVHFYFQINRASEPCGVCGDNGYSPDAQWVTESFYSHSSPFKLQTARELQSRAIMEGFGGGRRVEPVLGHGGYPDEATIARYGDAFRSFCEEMRRVGSWHDRITQDEVDSLQEEGRLCTWNAETKKHERIPLTAAQVNAGQTAGLGGGYSHDAIDRMILVRRRCERLGVPLTCLRCEGHGSVFVEPKAHLSLVLWMLHPRKGASRGVAVKRVERDELPAVYAWLRGADARNRERFSRIPASQ